MIQTTTLAIVVLSTFVLGGTTSPILNRLGMKSDSVDSAGGGRNNNADSSLREDFSNSQQQSMDDAAAQRGRPKGRQ